MLRFASSLRGNKVFEGAEHERIYVRRFVSVFKRIYGARGKMSLKGEVLFTKF